MPLAQQVLRANLGGFVFSLLVLFIGLAALAVHALRRKSKDRALLWFGMFISLYGIRALARHAISHIVFDLPDTAWNYTDSIISDIITTPALLYFEEIYGKGWKRCVDWLLIAQAAWGLTAIAIDIVRHSPGGTPDPSNLLLAAVVPILVVGYVCGYRPPRSSWAVLMFAAFGIFIASVIVDHLQQAGLTPWKVNVEPFGFLANLALLGYVAIRKFAANEQQLIAIEEEMKSAARIQASILPGGVPRVAGLSIAVRYEPMTAVAGDFYDFLATPAGVGILVADVTGHGVPAALVASMVKVSAASQAECADDPARVISALNHMLCRQTRGQFTTAGYLFLDPSHRNALYAAAGHPPLLVWRKGARELREMRDNGLLLGVRASEAYANTALELSPGDRLLLYTDGVVEAANKNQEFFGERRLAEFIAVNEDLPADAFADALLAKVNAWSEEPADDITLVVVDVGQASIPSSNGPHRSR